MKSIIISSAFAIMVFHCTSHSASLSPIGEAKAQYQTAAENGDPAAQFKLGTAFLKSGDYVDVINAEYWLEKSATSGYAESAIKLASIYLENGKLLNPSKGIYWLKSLRLDKDPTIQYQIGAMYANNTRIQNYKEAINWLTLSSQQGNIEATGLLGSLYLQGLGAPQNFETAFSLLGRAAEQGNGTAFSYLGAMYEFGLGRPRSIMYAHIMYNLSLARAQKDEKAQYFQKKLFDLSTQLTPAELGEAQAKASNWTEGSAIPTPEPYSKHRQPPTSPTSKKGYPSL